MEKYLERASYDWSVDSIRYINTPTTTSKRTYLYVQEIGDFMTSPPYFTERANLDSYLLVYTIAGTGKLEYCQKEYLLKENDVFFIHCTKHHYYECIEDWNFLWIHFNGIAARGYFEEFVKSGFRIIHMKKDSSFLEFTMRRILSLTQKKDLNSEVICSNLINNLVTELIIRNNTSNGNLSLMPEYIKNIAKYIDTNFKEDISLEKVASRVGFSKYHISREFKKYVGMTFTEYFITSRLNYAKELLKYSEEPVNEIAFLSGMNNVSHFINLFKEREDMTPLQYRKQWKG